MTLGDFSQVNRSMAAAQERVKARAASLGDPSQVDLSEAFARLAVHLAKIAQTRDPGRAERRALRAIRRWKRDVIQEIEAAE